MNPNRRDFAAEIRHNKRKSTVLLGMLFAVIVLLGWIFGESFGYRWWGIIVGAVVAVLMMLDAFYDGARRILN